MFYIVVSLHNRYSVFFQLPCLWGFLSLTVVRYIVFLNSICNILPVSWKLGPLPSSFPRTVLTLVLGDGQRQEGAEGGKGDCGEESTHEEEAT